MSGKAAEESSAAFVVRAHPVRGDVPAPRGGRPRTAVRAAPSSKLDRARLTVDLAP
ncbi:hypothetical protein [Streptomyces sp. DH-12]|uniref:hypothetical protein n=1 Tax=Streptomyces sp. DH-12 TaxID=2072509 RepID=UPI00130023F9|nr:hypothetical protein [Streptomyces sp. DH-12]